jgi:hypothetical protein
MKQSGGTDSTEYKYKVNVCKEDKPRGITNTHSTTYLVSIYKAENAVQMTKTLGNIINKPLSSNIACLGLKIAGITAVVKAKCPILSVRHCKAYLNFVHAYND